MREAWRDSAACRGVDTEIFFNPMLLAVARKFCRSCPVIGVCGDYARDHGEIGVWGGLTEVDRQQACSWCGGRTFVMPYDDTACVSWCGSCGLVRAAV